MRGHVSLVTCTTTWELLAIPTTSLMPDSIKLDDSLYAVHSAI